MGGLAWLWGAMGLIFPPSILVGGLLGAGAGALIGHLEGGMSRSDVKEVGEMLEDSEAALIVVGEATIERAVDDATRRAKKQLKKEIRADAREMERLSTRRSLQEAKDRKERQWRSTANRCREGSVIPWSVRARRLREGRVWSPSPP